MSQDQAQEDDRVEEPRFDKSEQEELHSKNEPSQGQWQELESFNSEVDIILHTVNINEYQAALTFLKPPNEKFEKAVILPMTHGLDVLPVVGYFGKHKVALIQTRPGNGARDFIDSALKIFKKTRFIIGVGVCYAFDRDKYKLGDVLVSARISDMGNAKFDKVVINRGPTYDVDNKFYSLFCSGCNSNFYRVAKPENGGRKCKVYCGLFLSLPYLMNNEEMRDKFKEPFPEAIAGEMEGGVLMDFKKKNQVEGVIVIKGVVDYGDGTKEKTWQFTAAMAALTYIESRLPYLQADTGAPDLKERQEKDVEVVVQRQEDVEKDAVDLNIAGEEINERVTEVKLSGQHQNTVEYDSMLDGPVNGSAAHRNGNRSENGTVAHREDSGQTSNGSAGRKRPSEGAEGNSPKRSRADCGPKSITLDSPLGGADLRIVKPFIEQLQNNEVVDVGVTLGLDFRKLNSIDDRRIHNEMITRWLGKQDYVKDTTGTPTLRKLVEAMRENGFHGVADEIESKYQ